MKNKWIWLVLLVVLLGFTYLTKGVSLPFLAGLAVAYFLDPLADKLEARKVPRGVAAALVIGLFFSVVIGSVLAMWPLLQSQILSFATSLPEAITNLKPWLDKTLINVGTTLGISIQEDTGGLLSSLSGDLVSRLQTGMGNILKGGLALFNLLSLLIISPVVAFYLLRDWDKIVDKVNDLLPKSKAETIREIARQIDTVLAGFVRGQMLVCCAMGVLYMIGWMLVGLQFAVVLGLLAGIMCFVPFVGALFAVGLALIIGVGQWGFDPVNLGFVALVFFVVQALEGAFLTPYFIGDRVGVHPVWILFAVFAGGEIMGFVGILIAVPTTAIIAVLARYTINQYMAHNHSPTSDA